MRADLQNGVDYQVNVLSYNLKTEMEKVDKKTVFKDGEDTSFTPSFDSFDKVVNFCKSFNQNGKFKHTFSDNKGNIPLPYVQITNEGLLISTIDIFPILKEKIRFFPIDEKFWRTFKDRYLFSMYEMMTLNGVKYMSKDYIVFFNGEKYFFNNSERSNQNSLGIHFNKNKELVLSYWSNFLVKSYLDLSPPLKINCPDNSSMERFKEILRLNSNLINMKFTDINNMTKATVYFTADHMSKSVLNIDRQDKFCYKGEWFNGKPFGNGTVSWIDKGSGFEISNKGFWYENQIYSDSFFNSEDFQVLIRECSLNKGKVLWLTSLGFEFFLQEQLDNFLMPLSSIKELVEGAVSNSAESSIRKFKVEKKRNYKIIINGQKLETMHQFCSSMFYRFRKLMKSVMAEKRNSKKMIKLYNHTQSKKNEGQLDSVTIFYPNGDEFYGKINRYGLKVGEGKYFWADGFMYKGSFFAGKPFGKGSIKSSLGTKRMGFFFNGYGLKQPYGVDKFLDKRLKKGYDQSADLLALDILSKPTIGEILINKNKEYSFNINYNQIFREIEDFKQNLAKDRKNVKDGELDYSHSWSDKTSDYIKRQIFIYNSIESEKKGGLKSKGKHDWMTKVQKGIFISNLSKFEREMIIEMIRDEEIEALNTLIKNLHNSPSNIRAFFSITDVRKRNLLQICGYRGHRTAFIDLISLLLRTKLRTGEKFSILTNEDIDKNNIFDLICIRGYDVDSSKNYYPCLDSADPDQRYLFKYIHDLQDVGMSEKNNKETNFRGPKILLEIDHLLDNRNRELFKDYLIDKHTISQDMNNILNREINTKEVFFMTNRSICLITLIKGLKILKQEGIRQRIRVSMYGFLKKSHYHNKRNNPLYFSLYWGDLHSTLVLLQEKPDMIFWKNPESNKPGSNRGGTAPQVIKKSGENIFKSRAIFASVLDEITRLFNFTVIEKILKEKVFPNDKKKDYFTRDKINLIRSRLRKKKFAVIECPLYYNNYVLLSDELCRQYLNNLRNISQFQHFKKKEISNDKYVHDNTPEIEAMQRNFLDFFSESDFRKDSFNPDIMEIRNNVKLILSWYVYIFGNAEINPEIYKLVNLDPFELVLDGRNIFHLMCMNNSFSILKRFIIFFKNEFKIGYPENWKRRWIAKLNQGTAANLNTPAHLCVIYNSIECLELLIYNGIDIDIPNLRGRTVRELLSIYDPYNLTKLNNKRVDNFENQIVEYLELVILSACKQHSIKYQYLEGSHENLIDVLSKSDYELKMKLRGFKKIVISRMKDIYKEYKFARKSLKQKHEFLKRMIHNKSNVEDMAADLLKSKVQNIVSPFSDILDAKRSSKPTRVNPADKLSAKGKQKFDFLKNNLPNATIQESQNLKNSDNDVRHSQFMSHKMDGPFSNSTNELNSLIVKAILSSERVLTISRGEIFEYLLSSSDTMGSINYKYKRFEKIKKRNFIQRMKDINFRLPLDSSLKYEFCIDSLFCIEILLPETERLQDHIVLLQINNIKKKYSKYGGGLRIEIIQGYEAFGGVLNKTKLTTYYILIKLTDSLLKHLGIQSQVKTFNMKGEFHTPLMNSDDAKECEPLRNYQKVNIMMKLIRTEFNIDVYQEKGILVKYFPIHNYIERKNFEKISKESLTLLFSDIFKSTGKLTLKIFTNLTFYHGIQQGFYFAFFSHYTTYLIYLVVLGMALIIPDFILEDRNNINWISVVGVGVWSSWMMNMWGRREKELAYNFDVSDEKKIVEIRSKYTGMAVIDEATFKVSKKSNDRVLFRYLVSPYFNPSLLLLCLFSGLRLFMESTCCLNI